MVNKQKIRERLEFGLCHTDLKQFNTHIFHTHIWLPLYLLVSQPQQLSNIAVFTDSYYENY